MKRGLFILSTLLIFVFLSGCARQKIENNIFENKNLNSYTQPEETNCSVNEDCVLSGNHPRAAGVCVSRAWQEEWDKNPESSNYYRDCLGGPVCSGPAFIAGGMRMPPNSCECVSGHCRGADLSGYPGCQMMGCE